MGMLSSAKGLAALLMSLWAVGPLGGQETHPDSERRVRLKGRCVDQQGNPVSDVELCDSRWFDPAARGTAGGQSIWPYSTGDLLPRDRNWRFTPADENGEFDIWIEPVSRRSELLQIVAFTKDRSLGATWHASLDAVPESVEIVLKPSARFRARISCRELGRDRMDATAYIQGVDPFIRWGRVGAKGDIDMVLPAGTYELHVYGVSDSPLFERDQVLELAPGSDVDFGEYDILAKFWQRYGGRRPPPIQFEGARGLDDERRPLDSMRGSWVLVDLMGRSSIARKSKRLTEIQRFDRRWREDHPNVEVPYQVLLVAESGASAFEEMEARLAAEDALPSGQIQHPVVFDPERRTAKAWRRQWLYSTILIAPDGTVCREIHDLDEVAAAIDGELPMPLPAVIGPRVLGESERADQEWLAIDILAPSEVRAMLRQKQLPPDAAKELLRSEAFNRRRIYIEPEIRVLLEQVVAVDLQDLADEIAFHDAKVNAWVDRAIDQQDIDTASFDDLLTERDRQRVTERLDQIVEDFKPVEGEVRSASEFFMDAFRRAIGDGAFRYRRFLRHARRITRTTYSFFLIDPDLHLELVELRKALEEKREAFVRKTAEAMVRAGAMDKEEIDRVIQYLCARYD